MSNKLHYKGYTAGIYYSAEDNLIYGVIEGIKASVSFHSDNTKDIIQHFHNAVDDYLLLCVNAGIEPEKPNEITSCDFCSKIWNSKSEYEEQFEYPYDAINAIVMENGSPYLYVPIEDYFYSDTYTKLNYCPKCGRKLQEAQQCTK